MLNFSQLKSLTIPEGNVTQIKVGDNVLWTKPKKPIGKLNVGDIITFKVSGVDTEFIIVQQGTPRNASGVASTLYNNCDGTWLLMKDAIDTSRTMNESLANYYNNSKMDYFLNNELGPCLEDSVQVWLVPANLPCVIGYGTGSVSALQRKIFLLSAPEVGLTVNMDGTPIHEDGSKLQYFEKNVANNWFLRSPVKNNTQMFVYVLNGGNPGVVNGNFNNTNIETHPAFILPSDFNTVGYKVNGIVQQ